MAIKRSRYNLTTGNGGKDTFHFQTDDKQVKIVDGQNQEQGSLKELSFEGKTVNGGSYRNIKITGLYKVAHLSGLPSAYRAGSTAILSVQAVGAMNNPELIRYTLILDDGDIQTNVVKRDGNESGWKSGGKSLENALQTLRSQLNSHNHDDRYVRLRGGALQSDLNLSSGRGLTSTNGNNIVGTDSAGNTKIGSSGVKLTLAGSEITTDRGAKIWHSGNDGAYSGLDADKLGGVSHANYMRKDRNGVLDNDLTIGGNLYVENGSITIGNGVTLRKVGVGGLRIGRVYMDNSGKLEAEGDLSSASGHLRLKNSASDRGSSLSRNGKETYLYDWADNKKAFSFNGSRGVFDVVSTFAINGKHLYISSSQPTGTHTKGSVWIKV